jgi:hypothetical protein
VSACFCVVLFCVSVETLRWAYPPTKESYQMSVDREVHQGRQRSANKDCRSQLKKKVIGSDWRRLHNEKLHNLYLSRDIMNVFECRRMG